jgi:hypothetical protein
MFLLLMACAVIICVVALITEFPKWHPIALGLMALAFVLQGVSFPR